MPDPILAVEITWGVTHQMKKKTKNKKNLPLSINKLILFKNVIRVARFYVLNGSDSLSSVHTLPHLEQRTHLEWGYRVRGN